MGNVAGLIAEKHGQHGTEAVELGQIACTADPHGDGGSLAVKGSVFVAGVTDGVAHRLQCHEMQRFHGGKHSGRHAVVEGVKGDIVEKGAPF